MAERGHSLSAFTAVVAVALFLVCGLVVDGGGQLAATSRAEHTAASAVRQATDAAAHAAPGDRPAAARAAAAGYLGSVTGITSTVDVTPNGITVHVRAEQDTVFLGLIGMPTVGGDATARGDLHFD